MKPTTWRMRKGMDRRFRNGHPWIYSNELDSSPKGIEPGAPIELHDAGGGFLARGFGNPSSLIAFRALSRDPAETDPLSAEGIRSRLSSALRVRQALGMSDASFRFCFGEADLLPGLVIDRYLIEGGTQAFVIQAHTAGMDRVLPHVISALEALVPELSRVSLERTAILVRNDVGIRAMEGLAEEEPRVAREARGLDLTKVRILLKPAVGGERPISFEADLVGGQKTGFFLDQAENIRRFASLWKPSDKKTIRVLDLCCYVGQWSSQFTAALRAAGHAVEVTVFDASATALEKAKANVAAQGASKVSAIQGDVLKDLGSLPEKGFDLVIADPPALIKGRKNIPAGTHAYLQLNTQAFRLVAVGGAIASCSCSALLEEEEFLAALSKAAHRGKRFVRWVARGGQAGDHPVLSEFPEGRYLKAWFGIVQ